MKFWKRGLSVVLSVALLFFTSCAHKALRSSRTIFAMDTVMTVTLLGSQSEQALEAAVSRIFELDALLSATNESSEIAKLNAAGGADIQLSSEVYELLESAVAYSARFAGFFDCTLAPLVSLWGFYTDELYIPTQEELQAALNTVGYQNIRLKGANIAALENGAQIDLGGIAKGYAAEQIRDLLSSYEIDSAILDLGGNVLALGEREDGTSWRVAVRDPVQTNDSICVFKGSDISFVTSGSYQRYFEENGVHYHHIMDPKTGIPAESDMLSVTIITENSEYADVLSTALFVMGYEEAVQFWRASNDFEAVFVLETGEIILTEGASSLLDSQIEALVLYR